MRRCKRDFLTRHAVLAIFSLTLLVWVFGCGGSRLAVDVETKPASLKGVFWDGPVGGLNYATQSLKGVTTAEGLFEYQPGESITFSIGNFVLGTTSGKPYITPLDMFPGAKDPSDQRVLNLCVVLQTLDADGDPENGISISEQIASVVSEHGNAISLNKTARAFSFDEGFRNVMAELNQIDAFGGEPRGVVPPAAAKRHLEASLKKLQEKKQGE